MADLARRAARLNAIQDQALQVARELLEGHATHDAVWIHERLKRLDRLEAKLAELRSRLR